MSLTKVPINDNEYKQSGSQFHQNDAPLLPKREYKMISKEKKTQLIRTVLLQKCKIKRIAKDLNINYATAKTILHNYRKKNIQFDQKEHLKQVSYSSTRKFSKLNLKIILNDKVVKEQEYVLPTI
ncbi:unnamed protein product (macronuclear) [Paramecium tetraurelia]|uniref:Uncharacterized protein n=1 Tax=Paramecium tetraurelia TaxID=5888 RepID=A0CV12_PARTE|nr:uncharacterized protein GSPATT00010797001 [Paramecium tetraurelia]CAK74629.1 unnamed protein product [Paramecium tetraurelia]|eukprot:XP_001442026.1 hypothetical protein (macronuclear) [Paramecium tetraurelia strain d4-2]